MTVQWVIKATKLCNLRCRYCYEYPWLGDPARIRPAQLARFFEHVATFYAGKKTKMEFVWHGGEPLLLGSEYFGQVFDLQDRIFGSSGVEFQNSIQTNLVRLPRCDIPLLRKFSNVGVSVDLFGDLRVDRRGRIMQSQTLDNMQALLDEGVRFGCIVVLSKGTAESLDGIFQFFSDLVLSFRLLPIYRTGFPDQHDTFGLNASEVVAALNRAVDLWFEMSTPIHVRPVQDYVTNVLRQHMGLVHRLGRYSSKLGETLYIVNTDGGLFSNADAYNPQYCYGNIFEAPLDELLKTEGYHKSKSERLQRMRDVCGECRFFGACSGFFMGEATPEQRYLDESGKLVCGTARSVQEYIEKKLVDAGVIDVETGELTTYFLDKREFIQQAAESLEFG